MGFFVPAAIIVFLDQLTKQLIWRHGQSYDIIDGYLHITLVKNSGAAFGLFQGGRAFFIVASVVAAGFIIYLAVRMPPSERYKRLLLGLILGGAIGNLIDRAYAGEVIDFIQMGIHRHFWPVFNVADMGVSIGATLLLIHLLSHNREDVPEGADLAADRTIPDDVSTPGGPGDV